MGGYLQYTTLLRNNASSSGNANVTLSVTCSGKLPYSSMQFSCRCTGIGLLELVLCDGVAYVHVAASIGRSDLKGLVQYIPVSKPHASCRNKRRRVLKSSCFQMQAFQKEFSVRALEMRSD